MVKFFIRQYHIPTTKDVEKLMARMDRLEQVIKASGAAKVRPGAKENVKGKTSRAGMTASDTVLNIIKPFNEGVGFAEIKARTGFDEKKLRNIIFRLDKIGKIRRKSRGVYIAV